MKRWLPLLLAVTGIMAQDLPKTFTTQELSEAVATDRDLLLLDVREPNELAEFGALKGYVNIPLGEVEKRLGEIPRNRKMVVYSNRGRRAATAAELLQKSGYTNIIGLAGLNEWRELKYELAYPPRVLSNGELEDTLAAGSDLFLLDVREPRELTELGTLKGFVNIPLGEVEKRLAEIPEDRKLLVYCNRAIRAAKAAAILVNNGYTNVIGVAGLKEWRELNYRLLYPPKSLSTAELRDTLAANSDLFLLDVREPKELAELGTLKGYVNIPLGEVERRMAEIPRDRKVLVYCNRAIRAAKAAAILVNNDYTNITGVAGLKEWRELNYDLVYPGKD